MAEIARVTIIGLFGEVTYWGNGGGGPTSRALRPNGSQKKAGARSWDCSGSSAVFLARNKGMFGHFSRNESPVERGSIHCELTTTTG